MSSKKYIPNLDSLRGIAAILVVISHFEQIKSYKNIAHIENWGIVGSIAVTIFFVLGGFLSTYFLINEKLKNGVINYSLFYSKRYIRIWPLYIVILGISFFWWPAHMGYEYLFLCIFMMSNVAFAMYGLNPVIDPIWTLGAEDQYYLIHPQLFRIKNFNTIFNWFLALFIGYILIRYTCKWFLPEYNRINFFLGKTRFDNFLLGGIAAFMYYEWIGKIEIPKLISLEMIFKKWIQITFSTSIIIYLVYSLFFDNQIFSELILSILLFPLILNFAFNENCIINIENKICNFVAKVSFSLYLSHKFIIYLFLSACKQKEIYSFINKTSYNHLLLYPIIFFITIGAAWLIYNYFEKTILAFKERMVAKNNH